MLYFIASSLLTAYVTGLVTRLWATDNKLWKPYYLVFVLLAYCTQWILLQEYLLPLERRSAITGELYVATAAASAVIAGGAYISLLKGWEQKLAAKKRKV